MAVLIHLTLSAKHFITQVELSGRVTGLSTVHCNRRDSWRPLYPLCPASAVWSQGSQRLCQSEPLSTKLFVMTHWGVLCTLQHFTCLVVITVTFWTVFAEHHVVLLHLRCLWSPCEMAWCMTCFLKWCNSRNMMIQYHKSSGLLALFWPRFCAYLCDAGQQMHSDLLLHIILFPLFILYSWSHKKLFLCFCK